MSRAARAVVLAAFLLAGCTPGAPPPQGGPPTTLPALPAPAESPSPPAQALRWAPCEGAKGFECSTLAVPVDWAVPGGEAIDVALARLPASGERLGALVVNPGGPGASGVDWLLGGAAGIVSEAVAERYDVVAFDPRGAGASAPLECLDDAGMDRYLAGGPGAAELLARGCAERAGPLLGHVDVASVARDLEALRAALGQERLNYLGYSWGTLLGATYAEQHPGLVGRMVLDGALDPALDGDDVALGQAAGLEGALGAYLEDCAQRASCPLPPDPAAGGQEVAGVLAAAADSPLPTGSERVLTQALALLGVIAPLYDDATWPLLDDALAAALGGDGAPLLGLADLYAGRGEDGRYGSNLLQVFTAVTCLDEPSEPGGPQATDEALAGVAPVLGGALAGEGDLCKGWPVPPVRDPAPVRAEGSPPILVVGTTGDPATPYPWARSLAGQLDTGALLTWEGEGHTAYQGGSGCVDAAVDAYLLDGVLPGEGATCRTS